MANAPRIPDLASCSADELRTLVIGLLEVNAKLEATVAALTEEIARLKNLKGRPQIKPSGMEKGTDTTAGIAPGGGNTKKLRRRPRRKQGQPKSARLIVDDDHVVPFTPEPGWRFKGYKPYTVQDLIIEVRVTRYWRPFYLTAEGKIVVAPLLRQQLGDFGMLISAGQISNLLTKDHDDFHAEKAAVKQAGLETARWLSVDDTTARHLGCNGIITQIGDDRFTSFDTQPSPHFPSAISKCYGCSCGLTAMPSLVLALAAPRFHASFACAEAIDGKPFVHSKFWCRSFKSKMRG
jgi:hypothetical protein